MIRRRETAFSGITVGVRPSGNVGKVGCRSITQDVLAERLSGGRDEVLGNIRHCIMTEGTPRANAGKSLEDKRRSKEKCFSHGGRQLKLLNGGSATDLWKEDTPIF